MGRPITNAIRLGGQHMLYLIASAALVLWSVSPTGAHVPDILQTLQDHAEMIETHGHSHGLEEDLAWAVHGHSHDKADHDHAQAVLLTARTDFSVSETDTIWRGLTQSHWSPPVFRLERPPRA